jgi:outer membrane lipoprotein-sorting protein
VILTILCLAAAPATKPATAPADAALWAKLNEIDSRAGQIKSLSAHFEQQKFTALLRKPLVSSGKIRINGPVIRWDTEKPEPSVLFIDPHEVKVFYAAQKTLEVYPLDKRLAELAASPLPRLAVLKEKFSFQQIGVAQLDASVRKKDCLALRLVPTDPSLAEHVRQVRVLLDIPRAFILKAEVTDGDGDRTELSFSDVQLNADVGDLALSVPPGTAVTHPLEGLDGQEPRPRGASK